MIHECQRWSERARMQLNAGKSKVMAFNENSRQRKARRLRKVNGTTCYPVPFHIASAFPSRTPDGFMCTLEEGETFDYLGLRLDSGLNMKEAVEHILEKANEGHPPGSSHNYLAHPTISFSFLTHTHTHIQDAYLAHPTISLFSFLSPPSFCFSNAHAYTHAGCRAASLLAAIFQTAHNHRRSVSVSHVSPVRASAPSPCSSTPPSSTTTTTTSPSYSMIPTNYIYIHIYTFMHIACWRIVACDGGRLIILAMNNDMIIGYQ